MGSSPNKPAEPLMVWTARNIEFTDSDLSTSPSTASRASSMAPSSSLDSRMKVCLIWFMSMAIPLCLRRREQDGIAELATDRQKVEDVDHGGAVMDEPQGVAAG